MQYNALVRSTAAACMQTLIRSPHNTELMNYIIYIYVYMHILCIRIYKHAPEEQENMGIYNYYIII